MKLLLLLISMTVAKAQLTSGTSPFNISDAKKLIEVRNTFDLLDEGQQKIILSEHRNLSLILGNTGSGKTTLIQWLFGDNDQLISTPTADGTFYIVDGNRIGHSTIKSKTLFPELIMDNSTDTAYYDCPGFSDTRSTSHDIAITYFIKRVADHALTIRLVFVVNYSSLRKGLDRMDFMKLLSHATELIKNVEKFGNSVALIATKVDNSYTENEDGGLDLISDENVINGIAEFLEEVKDALMDDSSKVKFIELINIFLKRNEEGSYSRIGIFRRPSRPGPLSKNKALRKGKLRAEKILHSIRFSSKHFDDFGYTVSDRSKSDISYLIRDIGVTVEDNIDIVGRLLLDNFEISVKSVETKLENFVSADFVDVNADQEIERLNNFLVLGIREISGMVEKMKALKNPSELYEIIRASLRNLKLELNINETLNTISNHGNYFDFLQLVSKQTFLIPKTWALNFENKAQDLSISRTKFQNYIKSIVEQVFYRVDNLFFSLGRTVYAHHKEVVERMKERINLRLNNTSIENVTIVDISEMKEASEKVMNVTSSSIQYIQNEENLTILYEKVMQGLGNISIDANITLQLEKFLNFLNRHNVDKMRKYWVISFEKETIKMTNSSEQFTRFINEMIEIVNERMSENIDRSMQITRYSCNNIAEHITYEIHSFVNGSLSSSNPLQLQKLDSKLSENLDAISNLSADIVYIANPFELGEKLLSFTSILDIGFRDNETANVTNQLVNNLDFLLKINEKPFTILLKWVKTLQATAKEVTEVRFNCDRATFDLINEVKNSIYNLIDDVNQSIRQFYVKLIKNMESRMDFRRNGSHVVDAIEAQSFRNSLILGIDTTLTLVNYTENLTNVTMLADNLNKSANDMQMELSADIVEKIEKNCLHLNYLQIIINETNVHVERSWVNQFKNTVQYLLVLREELRSSSSILALDIENAIEDLIVTFSDSLTEYYRQKIDNAKLELGYFTSNFAPKAIDKSIGKERASTVNNGANVMSNINKLIESMNTPLVLKKIINDANSNISGINIDKNFIQNVSLQVEILDFVLVAGNVAFRTPHQWLTPIRNASESWSNALENFIKTDINKACATVYSLIKSDLETLDRNIKQLYEAQIFEKSKNEAEKILKRIENEITKFGNKIKNPRQLFSYLDNVFDCAKELTSNEANTNHYAFNRLSHLEYMQAFSQSELISVRPFASFKPFETLLKFVREAGIWLTFLQKVREKLSEYEIQSDVSKYNVANLADWGKSYKKQGISIGRNNFNAFVNNLTYNDLKINETEVTDYRLRALDKILAATLRSRYETNCYYKKLQMRGNFIKFSDFISDQKIKTHLCGSDLREIVIIASETVFIDRSLSAIGSEYEISIEAPKWEVIGGQSIVLDGKDAQPLRPERANNGRHRGSNGENGRAGPEGGAAGSFTGTGTIFVDGNRLRISANGGRGERGQHGGHGADGRNGAIVSYDQIDNRDEFWTKPFMFWETSDFLHDRTKKLGLHQHCDDGKQTTNNDCVKSPGCVCYVYGQNAEEGGDGGDGGRGGAGGRAGHVNIDERGFSSGISISKSNGGDGEMGQGGNGGKGGKKQVVKLNYEIFHSFPFYKQRITFTFLEHLIEWAENGKRGKGK